MRLLPIPLRVACQIGLATLPQNRQVPLLLFCYHGSLQMYLLHVKNEMLYQGLPSAPRIIQLRNRISGLGAETGQILHAPRSTLHEKHQSGRGASKGERYSRYMSCSELYPTRKSTWYVLTTCPLSKAPTYLSLHFVAQRASKDMSPPPPAMLSTQGSPRATSGTTIGEGELIFFSLSRRRCLL